MTPPPDPADPVLRAVRDRLDRVAAAVDADTVLRRVRAASAASPRPARRWPRRLAAVAGGLAVAAGLLLAFTLGGGPEPQPVTAAQLVREAQTAHAGPLDRGYDVVAEWDPAPLAKVKLDPITRTSRLWTRGDQFYLTAVGPGGREVVWGQEKDGRVWVALSRKRALEYRADELSDPLARYCELMSLRVVSTLGEMLHSGTLARRDGGGPGEPIRLSADLPPTPARPDPRFRHVELELDPQTKAVRKAVLTRQINGVTVGTLTFTLSETATLPDDRYTLAGHLDADAKVIDGKTVPPPPMLGPVSPRFDPRARDRDEFLRRMRERYGDWKRK